MVTGIQFDGGFYLLLTAIASFCSRRAVLNPRQVVIARNQLRFGDRYRGVRKRLFGQVPAS